MAKGQKTPPKGTFEGPLLIPFGRPVEELDEVGRGGVGRGRSVRRNPPIFRRVRGGFPKGSIGGNMDTRGRSLPRGVFPGRFRPLLWPWDYEIRDQRPRKPIYPNGIF